MKKALLILLFFSGCSVALGQGGNTISTTSQGSTSQVCPFNQFIVDVVTPNLYYCPQGSAVKVTSGGGGGSPGGSNTQVQYNASSSFGGSANLTWVSPTLTIGASASATGVICLQTSTASGACINIQNGGATTAWTLALPASIPTTGGLFYCVVSSTTCTLTSDADFTISSHTLSMGASGILNLSAGAQSSFQLPVGSGFGPTADGYMAVNSATHALVYGSNGTAVVSAVAVTGAGNTATTCSNQAVTAISGVAAPTCTTLTGSYFGSSIAQNSVLAGPASGGAGAASFQTAPTISAANMTSFPTFNQNTTGNAATVTTAASTTNSAFSILTAASTSGSQSPSTIASFTINPSTGAMNVPGALTVSSCSGCGSVSLSFPLTVSGTTNSGGVPYFSNTTTLTSSAALTQYGVMYGGGAGAAPVAATPPSTFNIPYFWQTIPSGNAATAPQALVAGVPVDTQSSTTPAVGGDNATTAPKPDRASCINTTNTNTSTAMSIAAAAGSTNFGSNFVTCIINSGSVINTLTPTGSTINGNTTLKLVGAVSGHNPEQAFLYSDGTNWFGGEILPTDANGRLAAEGFGALTGDVTNTAGSYATTVGKINGTSLAGLASGLLYNTTTTGVPSIATAAQVNTTVSGLTGCSTATYVYTPAGADCVAPSGGSGYATIDNSGSSLTQRTTANIGAGLYAVDNGSNATNIRQLQPADGVWFREDFLTSTGNTVGGALIGSGGLQYAIQNVVGTGALANLNSAFPYMGGISLASAAVSTDDSVLITSNKVIPPPGASTYYLDFRVALASVTTNGSFAVGINDTNFNTAYSFINGTGFKGAWCQVANTTSAGNWTCYTYDGTTKTNVVLSPTQTASTSQTDIQIQVNSTTVSFLFNGTAVGSSTTHLPNDAMVAGWESLTGGANANTIDLISWTYSSKQ